MVHPQPLSHTPVVELRAGLERLARALATLDLDQILAAERMLTGALIAARKLAVPGCDPGGAREDLVAARAALARCRRLGASLDDLLKNLFEAEVQQGGYAADGRGLLAPAPVRVQARV